MSIFKVFDNDQLLDKAINALVNNYRHADYQRTIDVAKWCYQMNTGDDQREILVKFRAKESQRQQDQRVRVYNSRTQQVANKVKSLYNEVHRSDDIIDDLKIGEDPREAESTIKMLSGYIERFHGLQSVRDYLTKRNKHFNFFDPNAWSVVEFEGDGADRAIYPFEITSEQAVDFHYERGILQYVTACITRKFKNKQGDTVDNKKYTLYAAEVNIDVIEVPKDELIGFSVPDDYTLSQRESDKKMNVQFYWKIYTTENDHCPAVRFGFIEDPKTNGRTCISPLHYAEKTFQRLIWRTSTLDISHACHGFYKMLMYAERCNHQEMIQGNMYTCDNGYIGGTTCKACKGTGKRMHLSDQDVVMYLIDSARDKIEPLSNFIHYATISTELMQEQAKEVENAITDALSTIFNENIFDKSVLANTATGIHYNWRSVNNRLMDYADHDADMYTFIVKTIAMIQNVQSVEVNYGYPSDFKLESIQELLTERQTAVSANAPAEVIKSIDLKILGKQHRDDPESVAKFRVKERFKPLRTKSEQERIMILESLPDLHPMKVLNQYFDEIFDEIFILQPAFVLAPPLKQREYLDARVQVWVDKEQQYRQSNTLQFGQPIGDETEPVQQEA